MTPDERFDELTSKDVAVYTATDDLLFPPSGWAVEDRLRYVELMLAHVLRNMVRLS